MFTLHTFGGSVATSTALTNVPAAADPIASVSGNFLYVPTLANLVGVFGIGATLKRVQLQSPSIMQFAPYDVSPVDVATDPSSPLPIELMTASPVKLVTNEPLQALITNGATEDDVVAVILSDGPIAPVQGDVIRVRATATTPSTGYEWVNATISLVNQLAEGTYNLVGVRVEDAHGILFRMVFPNSPSSNRPGAIVAGGVSSLSSPLFRDGGLGVWGSFSNRVLPTIDFFNDGTTGTATIILDVVKTG